MDELTFILILAGIGVILLVAMFTYYKHHKKIKDEIENFNHHNTTLDDVLLNGDKLTDGELPDSFIASRQDNFDISQVKISHKNSDAESQRGTGERKARVDERELVDGVYINSKRVISSTTAAEPVESRINKSPTGNTTDTCNSYIKKTNNQPQNDRGKAAAPEVNSQKSNTAQQSPHVSEKNSRTIKVVYDPIPDGVEELIITHTILTKGDFFTGQHLFHALKNAGLFYGEMNIFHYPGDNNAQSYALFSVANIVEPGIFDLHEANTMKTPGVSLFMRLPTRVSSLDAYDEFVRVAQIIAADLGGELCDETRSQLTQQTIAYKKEQINKLNFDMAKAQKLADMGR